MPWEPVHCRPFVGRLRELDLLGERFRAAAAGTGTLVLVEGEAGIGKTRLTEEFCSRLRVRDERSALAHCFDYARDPLAPVSSLLAQLGHHGLPDVANRLGLFDALVTRFGEAARSTPTALLCEDVHWADNATLAFLQHLARSIGELRLLVVCTYRSDDLSPARELQQTLARLLRLPVTRRIVLQRLSDCEIEEVVERTLDHRFAIARAVRTRIRLLAEGNPLFAEELVKSAVDRAPDETPALPISISHITLERLDRLRTRERRLIECAATLGSAFDAAPLAYVGGESEAYVVNALRRACDAQILLQGSGTQLAFRHELVRQAIYEHIPIATRRLLHASIAKRLEARETSVSADTELAHHYAHTDDSDKCAYYNERAGDRATSVYASADAFRFYSVASRAARQTGEAQAILELKTAEAAHHAGLFEEARAAYERAESLFLHNGMAEPAALACLNASRLRFHAGDDEGSRRTAERAIGLLDRRTSCTLWFGCLVNLAYLDAMAGAPERALNRLARARSTGVQGRAADRLRYHEFAGIAHAALGDGAAAESAFGRALDIAAQAADAHDLVRLLTNCGIELSNLGGRTGLAFFRRAYEIAERAKVEDHFSALALLFYASSCDRLGMLTEAASLVERAAVITPDNITARILLAAVSTSVGRKLENDALLQRCANLDVLDAAMQARHRMRGELAVPFVELLRDRGQYDRYTELLHGIAELWSADTDRREDHWLLVQLALYGRDDDVDVARVVAKHLSRRFPLRAELRAHCALVEACLASRGHDRQRAALDARRAADIFDQLEWPYHRARALEVAGQKSQALAIYRKIGDLRDVRRLEASLRPANRRGGPKLALTQREREIASLVSEGRSNAQIAERLLIGERTVESHVASILQKLGATTRIEIAVHLLREGSATGTPS